MKIIIIDLEATCTDNAAIPVNKETIEIGAINIETKETFSCFINPKTEKKLTAFCTQLTSITQADIDNARPFKPVMEQFLEWAGKDFAMLSWGDYDKNQLNKDCKANGVDWEVSKHINLKAKYAELKHQKQRGLQAVLAQNNIPFKGTAHRGVDDAININSILEKYPELIEGM